MRTGTGTGISYRPSTGHSVVVVGLFAFMIGIIAGFLLNATLDTLSSMTTYF